MTNDRSAESLIERDVTDADLPSNRALNGWTFERVVPT
jgi:hypothetical protein